MLQQSDFRRQLVHTLRKLHGGPRFRNEFDMSTIITRYCKVVAEKKIPLPIGSKDGLDHVNSIATALSTFRDHLVPCHNDCIPENILSDGKKIYLVDFDYSGQNDPCFELGNLCVENGFSDSQIRELVDAYFDGVSNQTLSRTCLHGLLSDIGWSLWAFIQSSFSKIDFDFFSYGLKRWDRVVRKIANGETNTWLAWLFHTRS